MTARPSRTQAIADKCRECAYDEFARGAWREQVAMCVSVSCPLHAVRPVPRHCVSNGVIDRSAVAAIRSKLEEAEAKAAASRAKAA